MNEEAKLKLKNINNSNNIKFYNNNNFSQMYTIMDYILNNTRV